MSRKAQLLMRICLFFLMLEERALYDRRTKLAQFARKQYYKYRFLFEKEKAALAEATK